MDSTKRCPRCGETKDISAFYKARMRYDGASVYCIACTQERYRQKRDERNAGRPTQHELDVVRFWSKVDIRGEDDCWLWRKYVRAGWYPLFSIIGRRLLAHRYSYWLKTGEEPPTDLVVRHTCDVKACVNPKHLIIGTHKDNSNDAKERGRLRRGETHHMWHQPKETNFLHLHPELLLACEKHGRAKITNAQAEEIIRRHAGGKKAGGESCESLAAEFGVSPSAIRFLVHRKTWKRL